MKILGVDPRAYSTTLLVPPHPLPHVSRRALKRVRDRLEPPTHCNLCNFPVRLTRNREIYNGQDYGDWPFVYLCQGCGAYVGLHPSTDLPLGTLADFPTRQARKEAKNLFHRLMHTRFLGNRTRAYDGLARELRIDRKLCHFGLFDENQAMTAHRRILEMI